MKKCIVIVGVCLGILSIGMAPLPMHEQPVGATQTLEYFKEHAVEFADAVDDLQQQVNAIGTNNPAAIEKSKNALRQCRLRFKQIEFFFNYFFPSLAIIYNAPPVIEVEEPFMEYREPVGLQVIASLLYAPNPAAEKKKLLDQVSLIYQSARDLNSLLYNLEVTDQQVLESLQIELISIMTLGIAGFDAPELKTGIEEAAQSLTTLQTILIPYLEGKGQRADSVNFYLDAAIKFARKNPDFDSFNRMAFLTTAALPLQFHLDKLIRENGWASDNFKVIDIAKGNIFSPGAIGIGNPLSADMRKAALGKKLFFEKALSKNNIRSCATCHQPDKYFADGLAKQTALNGKTTLPRNTPSLLYSAFQYSQFWDGRAKSLEEQIEEVIVSPQEMHGSYDTIIAFLRSNKTYRADFEKVFGADTAITIRNLASSIAAYIETLAPFNSPFDRYIRGDKNAMTTEQVNGFNVFMGKALCGTCHTLPLFNGLTPPLYDRTVMEIIGTTSDTNFHRPVLDSDYGRYDTYRIDFYKHAFKTPGLRNVAATAPYMHHGNFPDLKSVIEFYNKGGGQGLGLNIPNQTLSPDSLQLNDREIREMISFLQALTDTIPAFSK